MARFAAATGFLLLGWVCCLSGAARVLADDASPVEYEPAPKALARSGPGLWSLAVSPNGKLLAAGTDDGRVLLRNTITQKIEQVLSGHDGNVSAVTFAPSGDFLASAGFDGQVRLWHLPSGRLQFTLSGHTNWITSLAFSPAGSSLASAGYDCTIRLWDAKTGVQKARWEGHAGTVRTLAFSPDGETLASSGDDGTVRSWNVKTGEHQELLPAQTDRIQAVAFSPDGKKLLTVPEEGKVQIWDRKTQKAEQSFTIVGPDEPETRPQTATFSPDGLSVLAGTRGGRVKTWSVADGKRLQNLNGHEDMLMGLAVSADDKTLYTAGLDGSIQAWTARLPLEPLFARLPIPAGKVWSLSLSPVGRTLAVGGQGGFVELWDLSTGQQSRVLEGFDSTADCLEYSPDGKLLAVASWRSKNITIWNADTGKVSSTLELADNLRCLAISPDGKQLAVGYSRHPALDVFSLPDGKPVRKLSEHGLPVYDVIFSPDGTKLASCSGEWTERTPGRVVIHDAADGTKLAQFDNHTHAVRSLTFTPGGSRLCSLSQDGILQMYDVNGLRESLTLRNGLAARPVACSADGNLLAAGLQTGNVNIWNLDRREIERRLGGTDDVFAVAFSRDGSLLFAADGNEFVEIWKLSAGENSLAHTVEAWLNHPASAEKPPKETP